MHLYYFCDSFFPKINSGSILSNDLINILIKNNTISVFTLKNSSVEAHEINKKIQIYRIKTIYNRNNIFLRGISEILIPFNFIFFLLFKNLKKPDGIIVYSPSIFFGIPALFLKIKYRKIKIYLILRDIFPKWYYDVNKKKKDLKYYFFKLIEITQYKIADRIGVQSHSNLKYFEKSNYFKKVEVLYNWLSPRPIIKPVYPLSFLETIKNKNVFIYAGNIGPSQNLENFFFAAKKIYEGHLNDNIFFLFIGDGYLSSYYKNFISENQIKNTLIIDHIDVKFLSFIYRFCNVGIVSLSLRHKIDNIPSKFISYCNSGLPVIALLNNKNDLIDIIEDNKIGITISKNNINLLVKKILEIDKRIKNKLYNPIKIKKFSKNLFSTDNAANQVSKFFET